MNYSIQLIQQSKTAVQFREKKLRIFTSQSLDTIATVLKCIADARKLSYYYGLISDQNFGSKCFGRANIYT